MLPPLFAIQNIRIWNAHSRQDRPHCLEIAGGLIAAVEENFSKLPSAARIPKDLVFDGGGLVLMPSGVDAQVHLRVPGQEQKEKPETGLMAALKGGVGALLTMPNTVPVLDCVVEIEKAMQIVAPSERMTGVDVFFTAAMTIGQKGQKAVDAESLARVERVKALTDDGRGVESDSVMEEVFRESEKSGLPLLQHAEYLGHGGSVSPSDQQKKLGLKAIPDESEWKMVERDIGLLKKFPKVRYHLLHASLKKSVELIQEAREKFGLKASCEVSPHHLVFSAEDIQEKETSFKMNPPLRSQENRDYLVRALVRGDIDFVATDHAPHEKASKGMDFNKSAFGTTGLETSLRVLINFYQKGLLSPERLVQVFSTKPAEFLGISEKYGAIRVGSPLRAILIDPDYKPQPLSESELESLSKNNVFLRHPLGGKIYTHFNGAGMFTFFKVEA